MSLEDSTEAPTHIPKMPSPENLHLLNSLLKQHRFKHVVRVSTMRKIFLITTDTTPEEEMLFQDLASQAHIDSFFVRRLSDPKSIVKVSSGMYPKLQDVCSWADSLKEGGTKIKEPHRNSKINEMIYFHPLYNKMKEDLRFCVSAGLSGYTNDNPSQKRWMRGIWRIMYHTHPTEPEKWEDLIRQL